MPPAKKRKTAAKAKGSKKDHVVTARASSPPPDERQPAEPAADEQPTQPEPATSAAPAPEAEPNTLEKSPEPQAKESSQPEPEPAPEQPESPPAEPSKPTKTKNPTTTTEPTSATDTTPSSSTTTLADRMARFRALQSRAKTSSASNLTAAQAEAHRLAHDPAQLTAIQRRSAIAGHKLLKADIEDRGGDFERQRAWDWTVDESARWDERQAHKSARRDDNVFSDFGAEAAKVYERQLRHLGDPDLERYAAGKMRAIEAAAARGTLELVETEDGEMVAVDKDGTFYGGGGGKGAGDVLSSFADGKPDKAAVDRLVGEMRKAEDVAARKRRERAARNGDDADVTYINDKNKQFNQKLARFYNKYTAEIRDSFERGTMI